MEGLEDRYVIVSLSDFFDTNVDRILCKSSAIISVITRDIMNNEYNNTMSVLQQIGNQTAQTAARLIMNSTYGLSSLRSEITIDMNGIILMPNFLNFHSDFYSTHETYEDKTVSYYVFESSKVAIEPVPVDVDKDGAKLWFEINYGLEH